MAYIGNTVQNQGFTPAIDYFNGNGVTVTFTLSRPIASVAQLIVAIDNVIQNPSTAFSVSGNSITFTSAPLSGTNNIWVEYTSLITTYNAISQDPTVIGDLTATGGYLAEGDFGNTFSDGAIIDYVTGTARVTTSAGDAITFYNGGTNARNPLMTLGATGQVAVNSSGSASAPVISKSDDLNTGIFFPAADTIAFSEGGTEAMRIASNGNVGIGTVNPTGAAGLTLAMNGGANQTRIALKNSDTGDGANDGFQIVLDAGGLGVNIEQRENDVLKFSTNATERMRIDASGRVTTPFQPAFYAFASSSIVYNNATVTLDSTKFNIGSCYSTSTGRFTAPVDGVYMFAATGRNNNTGTPILDLQHSAGYIISRLQFPGTAYYHHSLSAVTYLSANQYVYLGTAGEIEFDANGIDQFSGALIG